MANDVKNSGLPRPLGERNECAVAIDDPRGVGVWFPILSGTPSFVYDPALQCLSMDTLKAAMQEASLGRRLRVIVSCGTLQMGEERVLWAIVHFRVSWGLFPGGKIDGRMQYMQYTKII